MVWFVIVCVGGVSLRSPLCGLLGCLGPCICRWSSVCVRGVFGGSESSGSVLCETAHGVVAQICVVVSSFLQEWC